MRGRRRPITTEAIGSAATHPSLRGALATKQSRGHNMRGASNPDGRTAAPGLLPATRARGRNDGQGIGSLVSACRLSFVLSTVLASALVTVALPAAAPAGESYGIGRTATPQEIAGWDIDVAPDGAGLPPGHGGVDEGRAIYDEKCAACHGAHGEGKPMDRLAGGFGTVFDAKSERDRRQLLALRHDPVRLCAARDAVRRAAIADAGPSLRRLRLRPLPQQARSAGRGARRADAAEDRDAQSVPFRQRVYAAFRCNAIGSSVSSEARRKDAMIVDLRTYTMIPGRLNAWLKLYETDGYPIHVRHLGEPLGIFTTDVGTLNQVVLMWRYEKSDRSRAAPRGSRSRSGLDFLSQEERRSRQRPASREQDHQVDLVLAEVRRVVPLSRSCGRGPRELSFEVSPHPALRATFSRTAGEGRLNPSALAPPSRGTSPRCPRRRRRRSACRRAPSARETAPDRDG